MGNYRFENHQFENLYISSHREARNIKFGQQDRNIKFGHVYIERAPLGTPPQAAVLMISACNDVTDHFISN